MIKVHISRKSPKMDIHCIAFLLYGASLNSVSSEKVNSDLKGKWVLFQGKNLIYLCTPTLVEGDYSNGFVCLSGILSPQLLLQFSRDFDESFKLLFP